MARQADRGSPLDSAGGAGSRDVQWRRFHRQWSPMLRAYLSRLRCTRQEHDELVWDALVDAFEKCGWSADDPVAAEAAIRKATRDLARRWRAIARHETAINERGAELIDRGIVDPLRRADREAMCGYLGRLLGELPERQRAAVERHDLDGLAYADIAAELGCSAGSVKVRRHRGLRALRTLVLESPPSPRSTL